jgi:hypothetical protein
MTRTAARGGALRLLTLALVAGCGTFAGTESVTEALGRIPHVVAAEPGTEIERLLATTLEHVLATSHPGLPKRQPYIVARGPGFAPARITPRGLEARLVFLDREQLAELHERFGGTQYLELGVVTHGSDRATVDVATTTTVRPGAVALCCSARLYAYERKDGRWVRDDGGTRDVTF